MPSRKSKHDWSMIENIQIAYSSCPNFSEKVRSYRMSIKLPETQWFRFFNSFKSGYVFREEMHH